MITVLSEPDPQLERDKFNYNKSLFLALLTIALMLSFFDRAKMSEAVQIFIISVVISILIFQYFKEFPVGTITGKPGPLFRQTINNFGRKSATLDSFSDAYSTNRAKD